MKSELKDLKINGGRELSDNELIEIFMTGDTFGEDGFCNNTERKFSWRPGCYDPLRIEHLTYDKYWNWIIPVIEKIESNPINDVCIFKEATQIRVWSGDKEMFIWKVLEPDANSKIAHVFRAVVKYIKWYNETQSAEG